MPRLPSTPVWIWLLTFLAVLVWSAVEPKDYFTWFLEVTPALVALPDVLAQVALNKLNHTNGHGHMRDRLAA